MKSHLGFVSMLALVPLAAGAVDCKNHYILSEPCTPPGVRALETAIGMPGAVTAAPDGNVYFSSPNIVFRLDPVTGLLNRVAGNGLPGYTGDDGPAIAAQLSFPISYPELENDPIDFMELVGPLAVAPDGTLYIGDAYNNRVRKVDMAGTITTVIEPREYPFVWPQGLAVDATNTLYASYAYGAITRIAAGGTETQLAGPNCGAARFGPGVCAPEGIAVDQSGSVYVPDAYCRVRRITVDGVIATVAGLKCGNTGNGIPAIDAALSNVPYAVAAGIAGDWFVADTYNNCVRRIDADGIITTFAGTCRLGLPSNFWYFAAPNFYGDDGPAVEALLMRPHGIAVDAMGNVYIADTGNRRIRRVGSDGIITTVAGNGEDLP